MKHNTTYLQITRRLGNPTKETVDSETHANGEELDEADDEALDRISHHIHTEQLVVVHEVVHSPSYQVPVLYLTFQRVSPYKTLPYKPSTADEAYELLVPSLYKPAIQNVGIMGALSMTDHPMSGLPTYFVHPCRTAEAIQAIIGDVRNVEAERYLLMWLGMIGSSVGLDVPIELAEQMAPLVHG